MLRLREYFDIPLSFRSWAAKLASSAQQNSLRLTRLLTHSPFVGWIIFFFVTN
jgi:hypothetical protein